MIKKNRFFILSVIILSVITLILLLTNSTSTFRKSHSDFAVDDTSNITKIFMADKNNDALKLEKKGPGKWIVNEQYPAQKANVEMLLNTMLQLEVKETVPKTAHNNIIRDLAATSVKVEIYQRVYRIDFWGIRLMPHEKLTKVYYVGGATQSNRGSYMLMENSTEPFVVYMPGLRGFVSPRFTPIEKYWRDYSIFKTNILEIASVKMEFPSNPELSFEVNVSRDHRIRMISLQDHAEIPLFDTLKVMNFLASFRSVSFEALLNDMDKHVKDSILSSPPFVIISVTDTNKITKTIRTYHKQGQHDAVDYNQQPTPYDLDRLYALVNDGKDFTLIQYFVFDRILRPKTYFLKDEKRAPLKKK